MPTQTTNFVVEGASGQIGYFMRWYVTNMDRKEAYFLLRMHDVYAIRTPWKIENGTTSRRLQGELGRVILGSGETLWRWTDLDKNPSYQTTRQTHPKSSLTDNGPIGAPPARIRKGRKVPQKDKRRGVAKVLETAGVLVAKAFRDTVQPVIETGFGFGTEQGRYDILYCCRNPHKKATAKLLAHITKESFACQTKRQRQLLTTPLS